MLIINTILTILMTCITIKLIDFVKKTNIGDDNNYEIVSTFSVNLTNIFTNQNITKRLILMECPKNKKRVAEGFVPTEYNSLIDNWKNYKISNEQIISLLS